VDTATRPDGSILTVPRKNPKLAPDAYPTIFPNNPSYLSSEPTRKRKAPKERRQEMSEHDEQQFEQWMSDDLISSFVDFCNKLESVIAAEDSQWVVIRSCGFVDMCIVDMLNVPQFVLVVKLQESMIVEVYRGNSRLSISIVTWVLGSDCKLVRWSQLSSLLSHFASLAVTADDMTVKFRADTVKQQLNELIALTSDIDDYEPDVTIRLKFLAEQISLLFMSQSHDSSETLLVAFRFFAIYASIYSRLRSILTLPHVSYIKRLSSAFSLSGGLDESDHAEYLKHKVRLMEPHERQVILLYSTKYMWSQKRRTKVVA